MQNDYLKNRPFFPIFPKNSKIRHRSQPYLTLSSFFLSSYSAPSGTENIKRNITIFSCSFFSNYLFSNPTLRAKCEKSLPNFLWFFRKTSLKIFNKYIFMVRGGVKITTTLYYCSGRVTITSTINVTCLCQMALLGKRRKGMQRRNNIYFCEIEEQSQNKVNNRTMLAFSWTSDWCIAMFKRRNNPENM